MLREIGIADGSTDLQAAVRRRFDRVERQTVHVDHARRRFDVELHQIQREGIVKLLGLLLPPGNSRHFPDAISTDLTLSTTVVDRMLSWFHTLCGGWNHGGTTGAVHGAS